LNHVKRKCLNYGTCAVSCKKPLISKAVSHEHTFLFHGFLFIISITNIHMLREIKMKKMYTILITLTFLLIFWGLSCSGNLQKIESPDDSNKGMSKFHQQWHSKAAQMVKEQIESRGVKDERVLRAMKEVPRHRFVPEHLVPAAYNDNPLPIGQGQTISQPYIVALMTEELNLTGKEKVLEIGTGSGYQAAVLSLLAKEVYTIEIIKSLADSAREKLNELGYASNVHVKWGDGYRGWPEHAPFDCIIVTAAPESVPEALVEQLKPGGIMIIPVGKYYQELLRIRKTEKGTTKKSIIPVRFVPMVHPDRGIP
jgi:protein-L-isoaspartate(D-aspartate) O-methyltransferase